MKKNQGKKGVKSAKGKKKDKNKGSKRKPPSPPVEIIKHDPRASAPLASTVTDKMIDDFLFGSGTKLTPEHKVLFKKTAIAFQLNPIKREIYAIPYDTKNGIQMNIVVGYQVYLKRAERSEKLEYWKVWSEGLVKDESLKGCIKIKRKDQKEEFYHEVLYSEYVQTRWDIKLKKKVPTKMWTEKPVTMIKKVAMAQGFRLTFPDYDLGGMPYIREEIPEGDSEPKNITPPAEEKTWGEKELNVFNQIKEACKILGVDGEKLKIRFKIGGRFEDMELHQLQAIKKDLDKSIDEQGEKKK